MLSALRPPTDYSSISIERMVSGRKACNIRVMYVCQLTRHCSVLGGKRQAIGVCPLILFTVFGCCVEVQYTANRCGVLIMRK